MKLLKKILSDDMFRQGSTFFVALLSFNVLNFLYHFSMGRMLGPADYGIIGLLFSFIYIIMAPITTIQTVIAKFTAQFRAKKQLEKIKSFFVQSTKKMFIFSLAITFIFIVFSSPFADFFHIQDRSIVILFSLTFLVLFILAISRGFLQGLERFRALSISYIIEGASKFLLAVLLVFIGFRIYGAVIGIVLSVVVAFLFSYTLLKKPKHYKKIDSKEVYKYTTPVLIAITIITLVYNIDIILVKHYLSEISAGLYVALATLAKIIFWAGTAISFVMFPKVAEKFSRGKEHFSIFKKSLAMVSAISLILISVYIFAPEFVVLLLYGSRYIQVIQWLAVLGIAMVFLSFSYLIINYLLSINKFKFIYVLTFLFVLETILIMRFHETIQQVVNIVLIINIILTIYLGGVLIKNEIVSRNSSIQRRKSN